MRHVCVCWKHMFPMYMCFQLHVLGLLSHIPTGISLPLFSNLYLYIYFFPLFKVLMRTHSRTERKRERDNLVVLLINYYLLIILRKF